MGAPIADNLVHYEERILSSISDIVHQEFVYIGNNQFISTLSVRTEHAATTPLVFLHGVGTGAALWVLNLASVATAAQRTIYAVDMLGFGRSSRFTFSSDPAVAEMELVESVEAWRQALQLDTLILVGHCFGGYVAMSYALRYPKHVRHLLLVDPWGFSEQRTEVDSKGRNNAVGDRQLPTPLWVKILALLLQPFNPFGALRIAGSWGPALVTRFKPDLIQKYSSLFSDDTVAQYIYHWNAQTPSGETAFKHMSYDFGWARYPMIHRVKDIAAFLPMTLVCGARSSIDSSYCPRIQELRRESFVDIHVVGGAGHFVFADKPELFNHLVQRVCTLVDHQLDLPPRSPTRSRLRRVRSEVGQTLHGLSLMRRCDSQHVAEEEASVYMELGSHEAITDECHPVFVVADDELR